MAHATFKDHCCQINNDRTAPRALANDRAAPRASRASHARRDAARRRRQAPASLRACGETPPAPGAGLGLQSAVNVPIVRDRICVATFNCMSVRPAWSARQLALVRTLALLASAWIFQEVDRWQTSQAA